MGSGNSRLNSREGESLPIKIHTTLMGRFEEFRKRRNGESTLSKKQLLPDAEEGDGSTSNVSQSSSHGTNKTEYHKVLDSTVVPMENSKCETAEEKIDINKDNDLSQENIIDSNEKVEAEIKTEEGNIEEIVEEVKEEKSGENDDNDSDDDDESEEHGRYICPGSPSFRIYCIEADKRIAELQKLEDDEEEKCKSQTTIVLHQKSHSADSVQSTAASRNIRPSNEVHHIVVSDSITKKKVNKMRKFGAVRTLLKVKSCYHPMCTCTGEGRRHLMAAKAAN